MMDENQSSKQIGTSSNSNRGRGTDSADHVNTITKQCSTKQNYRIVLVELQNHKIVLIFQPLVLEHSPALWQIELK